jgi:sugar O-acyltransferase (sialic acid O-acetyltransferase NeuD family)
MNIKQKKPVIIYGNGHMAQMLYHFIKMQYNVEGFTVDSQCIKDTRSLESLPLIAFAEIEQYYPASSHDMLIAVGYGGMNAIRKQKYLEVKQKGYALINYIHPSVDVHENITIGDNNIILDHASIHPYSSIGNGNFISSNSNIGHGCTIGDFCWVNAGVSVGGESNLGNQCFYGINAVIGHGITIANECFIGANTLISQNTSPKGVYLSENSEKFRLESDLFLKFSSTI